MQHTTEKTRISEKNCSVEWHAQRKHMLPPCHARTHKISFFTQLNTFLLQTTFDLRIRWNDRGPRVSLCINKFKISGMVLTLQLSFFLKTKGHSLLRISDASLCSPHQTLISLAIQTSRFHETEGLNGRTMKSPLNKFHSML